MSVYGDFNFDQMSVKSYTTMQKWLLI